ncbi:hypothetical protein QYE76_050919 [Lolium multiflorum]|uniref:Uncharacterized protein n=1 Tax=Lolium multiflorum TaxID=4521 RepID=A0AAD8SS83_LOLMU|nr:hypothetical protein QYE76_050919 [Lolium multiflorum]
MASNLEKLVIHGSNTSNNPCPDADGDDACNNNGSEVETVRCACGVAEECTAAYVVGVRAAFCGDWLCGLCGEAVKERMARDPFCGVEAALASHEAERRDFDATRLNPTLSLAGSMRGIARKSFDRRRTTTASSSCQDRQLRTAASRAVALARSVSCDPRFLGDVDNGPAGDPCR